MNQTHQNQTSATNGNDVPNAAPTSNPENNTKGFGIFMIVMGIVGLQIGLHTINPMFLGGALFSIILGLTQVTRQ